MRDIELTKLIESRSTNVLVIDVQPEYSQGIYQLEDMVVFLHNQTGTIVAMWNGEEVGNDSTVHDVIEYWMSAGASDELVNRIDWVEKVHGFFRSWMSYGASDATIIKVIRAMAQNRINDSRDLDVEELRALVGEDWDNNMIDDPLYLPEIEVAKLKQLSPFYMMGGGRDECLREIELLCNAFNIRYKRIDELIY